MDFRKGLRNIMADDFQTCSRLLRSRNVHIVEEVFYVEMNRCRRKCLIHDDMLPAKCVICYPKPNTTRAHTPVTIPSIIRYFV